MKASAASHQERSFCNVAAQAAGLEPAGHAPSFREAVLVETRLPWRRGIYTDSGALPQEALDLMALWHRRYRETGLFAHYLLLMAPDPEYAQPGYRRVIHYRHPAGPFACYDKQEYLVPESETGKLIWALFEARTMLPQFEHCRAGHDGRDILICTHGTVDVACARFGYPLYRHLRDSFAGQSGYSTLRVWRVSHFGGHVFAPTLMDMPTGHSWAYTGERQAVQILKRTGPVSALHGHYRGGAGLEGGFVQAAECTLWQREGWPWFAWAKKGEVRILDKGDAPQWADVRIHCILPTEAKRLYHVRVAVSHTVETVSATAHTMPHTYPQYQATLLPSPVQPQEDIPTHCVPSGAEGRGHPVLVAQGKAGRAGQ